MAIKVDPDFSTLLCHILKMCSLPKCLRKNIVLRQLSPQLPIPPLTSII